MAQSRRRHATDIAVGLVAAAITGVASGEANALSGAGNAVLTAAASLLAWSVSHFLTSDHRGRARVAALVALVALGLGGWSLAGLRANTHPIGRPAAQIIDPARVSVVQGVDRQRPYPILRLPHERQPRTYPYVEIQPQNIVNHGHREVFRLDGENFTTYHLVRISVSTPDGDTALSTGAWADEGGGFSTTISWQPYAYLGVDGNDGAWPIEITDTFSGQSTHIQLEISSDASTPPSSNWPIATIAPRPLDPRFQVSVATIGHMCRGGPAISDISVTGATPNGGVSIYVLDPNGRAIAETGSIPDALGQDNFVRPIAWNTENCKPGQEFDYTVVAVDSKTGNQAKATLGLATN